MGLRQTSFLLVKVLSVGNLKKTDFVMFGNYSKDVASALQAMDSAFAPRVTCNQTLYKCFKRC